MPAKRAWASLIVGTVWAGMTGAALWLVCSFGFPLPIHDDYTYLVPVLTGEQPFSLGWLWELYGDNRLPLAKLVHAALVIVTGNRLLTGAFFSVLVLSAIALGLIVAARRVRGYAALTDAVFPLVLLNWGPYEN